MKANRFKVTTLALSALVVLLLIGVVSQTQSLNRLKTENTALKNASETDLSTLEAKEAEIEALLKEVASGKKTIETLQKELDALKERAVVPSEYAVKRITDAGFESLDAFYESVLKASLEIPYDGSLGGTMRWFPQEFKLINTQWVLGYFEDGHSAGYALLKYTLEGGDQVSWTVIAIELA